MADLSVSAQELDGGRHVVEARGEIDLYSAPSLRRELDRALDAGATSLLVDLSKAAFLDSFVLGVLVAVLKRVRAAGGSLVLVCPDEGARRVFEVAQLDRAFTMVDSRERGLELLGSARGEGGELPPEPAEHVV